MPSTTEKIEDLSRDIAEESAAVITNTSEVIADGAGGLVKSIKKTNRIAGPGLITGAADDDPSGVITYSTVGAQFGFRLSWLAFFSMPLMIAIQEMCARIGLVTGKGLAGVIKTNYGRIILFSAVFLLVFANTINIGADIGAMAAVMKLVWGVDFIFWACMVTIITLMLEIFISYKVYAKYLKWLTLSLFAYVITAFIVDINWVHVLKGTLIPSMDWSKVGLMAVVGFLGTTISPYLFFWQADEEVEEEIKEHKLITFGWGKPKVDRKNIKRLRIDVAMGMIFSNLIAFFIIITTAATLHQAGITSINDAAGAAAALKPLSSNLAVYLFTLGIIGTGLLGVPVLAGSAAYGLSEAFGWKEGLYRKFNQAKGFYGVIIAATALGLLMNFFGVNPIKGLYYAAIINGVIAPPLMVIILLISNNKKIMGDKTNGIWSNIFGVLALLLMTAAAIALFIFWGK